MEKVIVGVLLLIIMSCSNENPYYTDDVYDDSTTTQVSIGDTTTKDSVADNENRNRTVIIKVQDLIQNTSYLDVIYNDSDYVYSHLWLTTDELLCEIDSTIDSIYVYFTSYVKPTGGIYNYYIDTTISVVDTVSIVKDTTIINDSMSVQNITHIYKDTTYSVDTIYTTKVKLLHLEHNKIYDILQTEISNDIITIN
jgi:hypothetical protein